MKIELLKDWTEGADSFSAGTILDVDERTEKELIESETAKAYREITLVEEKASVEKLVDEAVKETIERFALTAHETGKPPRIEVGKQGVEDDPKLGYKNFGDFASEVIKAGKGLMIPDRLKAVTGMSEGTDADGGFLVPPEFATNVFEKASNVGQVLDRTSKFPVSGNSLSFPFVDESSRATGSRSGGLQAFWTEEAGQKSATNPTFGRIELRLKKLITLTPVTDELLDDSSIALEAFLTRTMGMEVGFAVDEALINGTGAGQPRGILNAASLVTVAKEGGQAATTIVAENVINMRARLWAASRGNSVWFINQDIEPQLHTLSIAVGTGGSLVYMPANGLSDSPFGTLFGRPVIPIEQAATLGTVGDIILADMSEYITIQKSLQMASSMHIRFDFDEVQFRGVTRIDGQPWWQSALTPFKGSNTQSPFVALATRA